MLHLHLVLGCVLLLGKATSAYVYKNVKPSDFECTRDSPTENTVYFSIGAPQVSQWNDLANRIGNVMFWK